MWSNPLHEEDSTPTRPSPLAQVWSPSSLSSRSSSGGTNLLQIPETAAGPRSPEHADVPPRSASAPPQQLAADQAALALAPAPRPHGPSRLAGPSNAQGLGIQSGPSATGTPRIVGTPTNAGKRAANREGPHWSRIFSEADLASAETSAPSDAPTQTPTRRSRLMLLKFWDRMNSAPPQSIRPRLMHRVPALEVFEQGAWGISQVWHIRPNYPSSGEFAEHASRASSDSLLTDSSVDSAELEGPDQRFDVLEIAPAIAALGQRAQLTQREQHQIISAVSQLVLTRAEADNPEVSQMNRLWEGLHVVIGSGESLRRVVLQLLPLTGEALADRRAFFEQATELPDSAEPTIFSHRWHDGDWGYARSKTLSNTQAQSLGLAVVLQLTWGRLIADVKVTGSGTRSSVRTERINRSAVESLRGLGRDITFDSVARLQVQLAAIMAPAGQVSERHEVEVRVLFKVPLESTRAKPQRIPTSPLTPTGSAGQVTPTRRSLGQLGTPRGPRPGSSTPSSRSVISVALPRTFDENAGRKFFSSVLMAPESVAFNGLLDKVRVALDLRDPRSGMDEALRRMINESNAMRTLRDLGAGIHSARFDRSHESRHEAISVPPNRDLFSAVRGIFARAVPGILQNSAAPVESLARLRAAVTQVTVLDTIASDKFEAMYKNQYGQGGRLDVGRGSEVGAGVALS
ncbi:MAG: hypothetical protein ACRC0L_08530, partial [Angustibacter sp.]